MSFQSITFTDNKVQQVEQFYEDGCTLLVQIINIWTVRTIMRSIMSVFEHFTV